MPAVIARTEELIKSGAATFVPASAGDNGPCGTGLCPTDTLQYDRQTTEETESAYIQFNAESEWAGTPVSLRLGLRYEQTDVVSEALSPNYTRLVWRGNELTAQSQGSTYTKGTGDYDYVLPNFDLGMDITDDLKFRTSLSRTLARPNYSDIQGGLTLDNPVRIGGGTGRAGSPDLLPYVSDNIDLSLEWYFAEGSYAAIGYFYKDVQNFIGIGSVNSTAGNLPHPALGRWDRRRASRRAVPTRACCTTGSWRTGRVPRASTPWPAPSPALQDGTLRRPSTCRFRSTSRSRRSTAGS